MSGIDVEIVNELDLVLLERFRCLRCEGKLLVSVRVPYPMQVLNGSTVHGSCMVRLCPVCDSGNADAQGLIAFFTLHETATCSESDEFAALLREWIDRALLAAVYTDRNLQSDIEDWYSGEI
jgi:hypothetical protein